MYGCMVGGGDGSGDGGESLGLKGRAISAPRALKAAVPALLVAALACGALATAACRACFAALDAALRAIAALFTDARAAAFDAFRA